MSKFNDVLYDALHQQKKKQSREWVVSEEDLGCDGSYFSYNEVIRCKDCKWYDRLDNAGTCCPIIECGNYPKEDGYCYMAARKEDKE